MQTCSIKISLLRIILGASFLTSLVMIMGCGQGLSGQAIGGDAGDIEVLKQEISDISDILADLDTSIAKIEDKLDVMNTSMTAPASLVEDGDQTGSNAW